MTVDIGLLLRREGLTRFQVQFVDRGYVPAFSGATKSFRATDAGVRIDVITTGEYPGDGKPKPVVYPEPDDIAIEVDGVQVIKLEKLIEFKLASGISALHRLRDLADGSGYEPHTQAAEGFCEPPGRQRSHRLPGPLAARANHRPQRKRARI
jgi:hypothetical protein